jgi:hypothetical protein
VRKFTVGFVLVNISLDCDNLHVSIIMVVGLLLVILDDGRLNCACQQLGFVCFNLFVCFSLSCARARQKRKQEEILSNFMI